jgi:KDO2-lipid IV(A) lauroyltransferase
MPTILLKTVLHLLAFLPLRVTHAFAVPIARWLLQHSRLHQVIRTNIRLCFPSHSALAQKMLVQRSLIETVKTFTELGALWLWQPKQLFEKIQSVNNEQCLQQAVQQGKGVILLTPHFGAWELAGLYASSRYPLTALYRPPKLKGLQTFIHHARQRAGGCYVATEPKGIRALYQALRRGEVIGILPDQVPSEDGAGIFAPFFGMPAYTMTLIARLVQKTGAPVIFTYAQRLSSGSGYTIHFFTASAEIAAANVEVATAALNQGIEKCIAAEITQYQWSYKRFKRLPNGYEPVY